MCSGADQIQPSTIAPFGTVMSAIGSLVAGNSARDAGAAHRTAADYRAAQLEQNASNVVAAGQRTAADERLKAQLLASRAIAVAGSQGSPVTDGDVTKIVSDITGRGAYNAAIALYNAEDQARQMNMGAEAERFTGAVQEAGGKQKQAAYSFGAAGKLAEASSLFSKYGRGGPKAAQDDWSA